MTAARIIPDAVRDVQIDAANPDASVFVSANAGSGKTHVLAQRVINLLLRGVDPAKILCITFTKAAAANMANRVFGTLAGWTALDDDKLDEEIRLSTKKKPDAKQRARARRLFASALETPGGLKVQTIHAFCTRLLHQFPFEANVAARFTVLDEAATQQLLERLTLDVLLEASANADSALGRALAAAIVVAADQTFKDVIGEAIGQRDAIQGWIERAGSIDNAMAELAQRFNLAPDDSLEKVERDFFAASHIPDVDWPTLIEIFRGGSANDQKQAAALETARIATGRDRVDTYLKLFCTAELAPRKSLITKRLADKHPDWLARLGDEQDRVCALLARERALEACARTRALVTIAKTVIDRYQAEKDRRGLLDYDDLIDKTLPLLSDGAASWVHYKLDLGIDHMLIDEAQDTSPKQWQIIRLLAGEFASGGARPELKRTIFAVGDEKQSIFSFQGAAPAAFSESRRHFEKYFRDAETAFVEKKFEFSFRSGEIILGAVDKVYSRPEAFEGLSADRVKTVHSALPDAAPGLVELWPLIEPAERKEIEGWDAPFDIVSEQSPRVRLAQKIARHVKRWTDNGLSPGDVLVLVRQRGPLFEAIIRALKDARVPVAGADRLVLTGHIAVMDLMALADSLLLDSDDLALASVLKSPLFGITEKQLFELAWNRESSLRAALRARKDDAPFGAIEAELAYLADTARRLSPFAFFADVLGPRHGRKKLLARLGPEANDALDEFLNFALDYEARETPSLQGFLAWLRAAQSEVKRDMELARDEVRVMTVHGAKGLEAETVILADTTTEPKGSHPPRLLGLGNDTLVWATRKQDDTEAMETARQKIQSDARDEYRRLLYVAMTRAKQRLVICGVKGDKAIPDGCWYQLVDDALRTECIAEAAGDGEVLRYRKGAAPAASPKTKSVQPPAKIALPDWLARDATVETPALRTLAPSSPDDDDEAARRAPSSAGASLARLRGVLAHRLLQSLPDIAPDRRAKMAGDYLARAGATLKPEDRSELANKVMRVLEYPRFYELYGPGSRSEVPVVGRVTIGGTGWRVSGQVDRFVAGQDAVLIADFKTNREPPRRIEDVPQAYVRQLALYRAVLAQLYPGKAVRCALVWTEVPDLMELSGEALDEALARITPA